MSPMPLTLELGPSFVSEQVESDEEHLVFATSPEHIGRVLARDVDPMSVVLEWSGPWRFSQGGMMRNEQWHGQKGLRGYPTAVAAALLRFALLGEEPAVARPLVPEVLPAGAEPLRHLLEKYLLHELHGATNTNSAEMVAELEGLRVEGPNADEWCRDSLQRYFQRERQREEVELRQMTGVAAPSTLPAEIDARLIVDACDGAYLVASDWMQVNTPARGELAAVQRALARATGAERETLIARERELFRLHEELSPEPSLEQFWQWREGWIHTLVARRPPDHSWDIERTLLHQAARYVRAVLVPAGVGGTPLVLDALEAVKPRGLRRVELSSGGKSAEERVRAAMPWVLDVSAAEGGDAGGGWAEAFGWEPGNR